MTTTGVESIAVFLQAKLKNRIKEDAKTNLKFFQY
jgi:hypothetical protein